MTWLNGISVEPKGVYELRGCWAERGYQWRARVIDSDVLVWASWDLDYVNSVVERHAANVARLA